MDFFFENPFPDEPILSGHECYKELYKKEFIEFINSQYPNHIITCNQTSFQYDESLPIVILTNIINNLRNILSQFKIFKKTKVDINIQIMYLYQNNFVEVSRFFNKSISELDHFVKNCPDRLKDDLTELKDYYRKHKKSLISIKTKCDDIHNQICSHKTTHTCLPTVYI